MPHILTLTLLLAAAATGAQPAAAPDAKWSMEPAGGLERWSLVTPADGATSLEVSNPYGDVHLRNAGPGGILDLSAAIQQLDGDARLEPVLRREDGRLVVELVTTRAGRVQTSRADLAVLVPEGMRVAVSTDTGRVEARGLRGDLEVRTASGAIRAGGVHGALRLSSASGTVEASVVPGAATTLQRLETVTGAISAWVPADADLEVTMATSGTLTTDVSLAVEHHDLEEPDKLARAVLGAGGARLELRSRRGDLALRRVVPAHPAGTGAVD